MLNLKKLLSKTLEEIADLKAAPSGVDAVVQQGTSGNSNYRVWNNGTVEVWGVVNANCNGMSSFATSLYRIAKELSFPILGTLGVTTITSEQFSVRTTGGSGYATVWSAYIDASNKAHIQVVGSNASAGTVAIDYYIVGTKS